MRGKLRSRIEDPGIDQPGQDIVEVIGERMTGRDLFADLIKSKAVIDLLQKKITAVVRFLIAHFQELDRREADDDGLPFLILPTVQFIDILLCPDIGIPTTGFRADLFQVSKLFDRDGRNGTVFFADAFLNIKRCRVFRFTHS